MSKSIMIDVSEMKTKRDCHRKWAFSSRNKMHLRSKVTPPALALGIAFHKGLELLYMGVSPDIDGLCTTYGVLDFDEQRILRTMLEGYEENIIRLDIEKYEILDTEYKFQIPVEGTNIIVTGSIDMVVRERATGKIFGFEHKSAKNWRPEIYDILDEQPQMYFIAIEKGFGRCDGIFINQVKKLKTKFDIKRTLLTYSKARLDNFFKCFVKDCHEINNMKDDNEFTASPSYIKCTMCMYADLCISIETSDSIDVSNISESEIEILGLEKRLIDHLDEK